MSTYNKETKHPNTGEWHNATWRDDFYGHHHYGVEFPNGEMFDPEKTKLETVFSDQEIKKEIADNEAQLGQVFEDGMKVGRQEVLKEVLELEQTQSSRHDWSISVEQIKSLKDNEDI